MSHLLMLCVAHLNWTSNRQSEFLGDFPENYHGLRNSDRLFDALGLHRRYCSANFIKVRAVGPTTSNSTAEVGPSPY